MTELEEAWLESYLETGDAKQALREAGSQCSDATLASRASQMKRKLSDEIDKALRERFGSDAPVYYGVVKGLATGAKSEDVQLKAARDALDRGGYKAPEKHEHTVRHEGEISRDIRNLIASMDPQTLKDAGLGEIIDGEFEHVPAVGQEQGTG